MKYDHLIKYNGVYYQAGEDVPCNPPILVDENDVPKGTGTIDAETVAEVREEAGKHFTRTEISRMPVDELKAYAPKIGIEVTEESTGAKLKEQIIAQLGL